MGKMQASNQTNETTRGHVGKLFVHHSRVDVREYFL